MEASQAGSGDVLIVVDVQNDFLPGGPLAVPRAEEILPELNRWLGMFQDRHLPVFATRDWHPADHCSFWAQGGRWPRHCVAGTAGAAFAAGLKLPTDARVVSKASMRERDAYSGFDGTDLEAQLLALQARRLFVGGLATDYCVLSTVKDARARGFDVCWLSDAVRAVELLPGDGERAERSMLKLGAHPVHFPGVPA